ncbi:hypothetical protein EDD72_106102 [Tepidibacillus fermentans]|uniref:Uncharacterized protein n=2 Tax=Tepidibacillus fermentans TaxID=1281767 RepID=A0A4R3KIR5_9BACI|nr:hypothetical protein EDD72_106102 [Tepidibacillus fermentans]
MVYQRKEGKPFVLKDIDPLFYACCYLNTNRMFLMEKEKFFNEMQKGLISKLSAVANL